MLLPSAWLADLAPWAPMMKAGGRPVEVRPYDGPPRLEYPYQGRIDFQGLDIFVENRKGSVRSGKDSDGRPWSTTMTAHYGEFAGTLGADGDPVDVFVGPDADAVVAYVVHTKVPGTQVFDEDKVILGCRTAREAEALFRSNYERAGFFAGITIWPVDELRAFLATPQHEGQKLDRPERVRALLKGGRIVLQKAAKPPGTGWTMIPQSRHGGWHRQKAGGGWEHWYPTHTARRAHADELTAEHAAAGRKVDTHDRARATAKKMAGWHDDDRPTPEEGSDEHIALSQYDRHDSAVKKHLRTQLRTSAAMKRVTSAQVGDGSHMEAVHDWEAENGDHPEEHMAVFTEDGELVDVATPEDTRAAARELGRDLDPRVVCVVTPGMVRGARNGVLTHNHPSGGWFSGQDLDIAAKLDVSELRATGRHGTWSIKRPAQGWAGSVSLFKSRLRRASGITVRHASDKMDAHIRAAGGDPKDGQNAQGFDDNVWRRLCGAEHAARFEQLRDHHGLGFLELTPRAGAAPAEGRGDPAGGGDAGVRGDDELSKAALRSLLKATIRTPKGADGKVNYDAVPSGASIWVTVTNPASPLHGRPILITKRPDGQFALTGGAGAKHIQGRRHMAVGGGEAKASDRDVAAQTARLAAEGRNAPKKKLVAEARRSARKAQRQAEDAFMRALGIEKRGLSKEEKAEVQASAAEHARELGMDDAEAESFAKHVARGIAKKDRERRVRQAARRLDYARFLAQGEDEERAAEMAGPELPAVSLDAPVVDREAWAGMSETEREHAVATALDEATARADQERIDASRFESDDVGEGEIAALAPGEQPPPAEDLVETPAAGEYGQVEDQPHTAHATEDIPDVQADAHVDDTPDSEPDVEPSGRTFTVGHEDQPTEDEEAAEAVRPLLSREKAQEAMEQFREYAEQKKMARDVAKTLEELPEVELASPSVLERLRLEAEGASDDEVEAMMADYVKRNTGPADDALYGALSEHWNDTIGNKLSGAVADGASSAITGLVGGEIAARYDAKRLVEAFGPEVACMAVVQRMREEMDPADFRAFVSKVGEHNVENQRATERQALERHAELRKQSEDLERQVGAGDLQAKATIAMLRAQNLMEQRQNLGGALGSLQASAALYHHGEMIQAEKWKKEEPITITVGSRMALDDKLRRLGSMRHTVSFHPVHGYQIQTTTGALRRYVGRTQRQKADDDRWREVKFSSAGIKPDADGREWVPDYKVHGFRSHFPDEAQLPADMKHLAGKPISLMADQRNNIEWVAGSGGGLVKMRTGGGKTLVSIGVGAKLLEKNPDGRHLRIVPDGREEQWAQEVRNFTGVPVVVLPAKSKKEDRHRMLAQAPKGSIVIVGHTNAGRYDHGALAEFHEWDSVGIDEPQELRSKTGSGKMSAGARRIFKIPAKNRHGLTATPANEHSAEAYDIVNWARPGVLGYRTRFERSFSGFGAGTNAQEGALQKALYSELEPHLSAYRAVPTHYDVDHVDQRVSLSESQLSAQRDIESRVDSTVEEAVQTAYQKKRDGVRGYENKSYAALRRQATDKAMAKLTAEHRANLGGGDMAHNPKLAQLHKTIGSTDDGHRHVVFVDSPAQRRSVVDAMKSSGRKVWNIDTSARGATRLDESGQRVGAIEMRKREWKTSQGGVIVIDRTSASGHNLAEGDHLHVLGDPDSADQMLQAWGRLGRSNRTGDFKIHTYRYDDSPFAHQTWNKLDRQVRMLRATAPDLFVEGRSGQMQKGEPLTGIEKLSELLTAWMERAFGRFRGAARAVRGDDDQGPPTSAGGVRFVVRT